MEEKKLKIFHLPISTNATNTLRVHAFKDEAERQGLAEMFIYDPDRDEKMTESDIKRAIQESDLVMCRETPTPMVLLVREAFPRKRIIYDIDDNPWEVLPSSTSYRNLGTEDVIINNKPIWMMVYYGKIIKGDKREIYSFLQKALRTIPQIAPYRGDREVRDENFKYENTWNGNIENFSGTETILFKEKKIYEASYLGGMVDVDGRV